MTNKCVQPLRHATMNIQVWSSRMQLTHMDCPRTHSSHTPPHARVHSPQMPKHACVLGFYTRWFVDPSIRTSVLLVYFNAIKYSCHFVKTAFVNIRHHFEQNLASSNQNSIWGATGMTSERCHNPLSIGIWSTYGLYERIWFWHFIGFTLNLCHTCIFLYLLNIVKC